MGNFGLEEQLNICGWTMAILRDDDFGKALLHARPMCAYGFAHRVVVRLPKHKEDYIGNILLDGSAVAKVGQVRSFMVTTARAQGNWRAADRVACGCVSGIYSIFHVMSVLIRTAARGTKT